MYGDKKDWGGKIKTEDKEKYKISIHMIEEGVLTDFDDVELTDSRVFQRMVCQRMAEQRM